MDYNCYHFGSSTVDRDIGVDWNKNIYGTESESMCAANELSNYHNVILCSIVMSTSSGLKKRMTLDLDRYISHVTSCVYTVVELYRRMFMALVFFSIATKPHIHQSYNRYR